LYLFIKAAIKLAVVTTYTVVSSIQVSRFIPYVDETIKIIRVDFDVIDQLLIRYSTFVRYWS